MTEPSVQSLRLPGSRWVLQWRDDGRWRDVTTDQLADELLDRQPPSTDDWVPWTGDHGWQGRGGSVDGGPATFSLIGELPAEGDVEVRLADGSRPAVHTVGKIWGATWHAAPQPVTVLVGHDERTLDLRSWGMYGRHSDSVDATRDPHVRRARPSDVEALVFLRQENGRVHEALDPTIYRVPRAETARRHFERFLAEADDRKAVLVLADGSEIFGMVEVSLDDPPPGHQVLQPTPTARLHVVVAPQARGQGIGTALEAAAGDWAAAQGARLLVAGIQADNEAAQQFYGWAGYRDQAVVMVRDLAAPRR